MKIFQFANTVAVALAFLGLFVPSIAAGAVPGTAAPVVADVALAPGGLLQGRLVDTGGIALAAQSVAVVYDGKVVAKSTTDRDGNFRVSGLRGGSHMIATNGTSSLCRLWAGNAAPPQSHASVLIVEPQVAVRGQGCGSCGNPGCTGCGGVAGGPLHGGGPLSGGGIGRFVNARTLLIGAAVGGIIWAATDDDNRRSASGVNP